MLGKSVTSGSQTWLCKTAKLKTHAFVMYLQCYLVMVIMGVAMFASNVEGESYKPNTERKIRDHILFDRNYSSRERPVLNSNDTLEVTLCVFLHAMLHLNQKDQTIRTASWVAFKWIDPRLSWDPKDFDGQDLISLHHDEVWLPSVNLGNGMETTSVIDPEHGWIVLASTGEIYLGSPFTQSSYCPLRIKYFPFDSQTCPLKFNSQNVPAEKVLLKAGVGILSGELSSSEWHAEAFNGTHRTFNEKNILSNRPLLPFSQVRFCLYLTRYSRYYVMLLIVPSTILNLMTLMTFFSPPDSGERISLSISMIVGLTVFQLLVADMLPATRGNDNPILGSYLTGNFILAVVAIPFSLFTANIIYNNPTKTSLTKKVLDAIMPVMYLLKLLKKPGRRIGTVTSVDESVKRADSLTPVDVIDGEPIRRTGRKEERRGTENDPSAEQRQALFFKNVEEARLVANALDRLFFLLFLLAIVFIFVVMVIRFLGRGDYHKEGGC